MYLSVFFFNRIFFRVQDREHSTLHFFIHFIHFKLGTTLIVFAITNSKKEEIEIMIQIQCINWWFSSTFILRDIKIWIWVEGTSPWASFRIQFPLEVPLMDSIQINSPWKFLGYLILSQTILLVLGSLCWVWMLSLDSNKLVNLGVIFFGLQAVCPGYITYNKTKKMQYAKINCMTITLAFDTTFLENTI